MTAQAYDAITYRERTYSLIVVEGQPLFEPVAHGLRPVMISTGNWAGFLCLFGVADAQLYLERVTLGMGAEDREAVARGEGPRLFGVAPVLDERSYEVSYPDLHQPLAFTGTLTLGADFVWDQYVHMGFHPPWKYQVVIDLAFEAGKLARETDRSAEMAQLREAMASGSVESLFNPALFKP